MLLKRKIMLGAVILAALPVLSSSLAIQNLTASKSQAALEQAAKERLTAVRDLTRERIEDYFGLIRHQVITYSEDLMIIDAMRHFKAGFDSYREELEPEIPALRSQLKSYYTSDFATEYARRNPGEQAPTDRWLSQLDSDSIALQYQYIKASPHPLGEKHKLDDPSDGSSYAKHHKKYHPVIRGFLEKFNYYDIFLVDPDSGDIVYSVYKEVDFTTTLKTGLYAGTKIGEVFKRANQAVSADFIAISSFSPYSPSYEDPAGFIASPIFDGKRKIGILIFQMPISHINKVMTNNRNWKQVGLGDSGETYLIAADTLMLSNSRFLLDDKAGYLQAIRDAGVAEKTVNSIASKNTSIGFHPVETQGSKAALAGETGFAIFPDYRNVEVLSAYAPLTIEGKNWAIMAEIDKAEAFAAADELSQQLLTLSAAIAGVLLILALGTGIWFSGLFTRPILALSRTIETIDRNADLTQQVEINSNDEIGLAATAFNNLTTKIRSSLQQVNDASAHLATTAEETSVITQQTSQVVQGQLMETTQVATAMNEMSATVQEVANNTTNSSQAAREANESATSGQQAMQQTITQIDELAANIAGASDVIQRVEKNSEEINTVLDVIKSIAEQTNLLALNAAIEAARAGEQGRGFAVVADEVRTLANRTQESTEEINKIIEKLQSGSHQAVECMEMSREMAVSAVEQASNTGATLSTIVQAIGQINDMSTQIANAAEEQSAVAGEINRNVVQINDMTEQTAAGAQQTAAASGDQARLASQLKILVSQFKV